jgi:signal transduction histidine kinase/DNA-binding response OmpR family regulator
MSEQNSGNHSARLAALETDNRLLREALLATEHALAVSREQIKVGLAELLASETALASSQAETKAGVADLLASVIALATSRAETKTGVADLLASETALATSRAETKTGVADLLASETALATSRGETKIGVADLLASETALASSQAETKIGVADLLASVTALATSRAETKTGVAELLASETANIRLETLARELATARDALKQNNKALEHNNAALETSNRDLESEVTIRKVAEASLHAAKEAAEQASEAKSRFLAAITHDLRTPLHGILGYVELLFLDGDLNPTQSQRMEAITAAGQYLLGTINSVLDMSEIEADRVELHPVEIEPHDFIRTCFAVVRPRAEAKGLALVLAPAAAPLRLYADSTRLQQVVINLLGNAVKFTPTGSVEVRLQPSASGEGIRLEVADTGPGILERHRDKLFQAFERLNTKAVSNIEGMGLGLAIAARLVRLMGGEIGYARNPGGGSVFWVELPQGVVPSAAVAVAASSPTAPTTRLRVLVADDEAMNRSIASGFLSKAGHEVVCVDNGAAAVEAAATVDFDVILMDVRMPVMDGLEATRRIRALPPPRGEICVLAITAHAFVQQIEACRLAGMDGHLAKPFKRAALFAELEKVIMERRAVAPTALTVDAEHKLPIFDRTVFREIAELLSAAELEENLTTVITRAEALLSKLRMPGMQCNERELAEAAHKLAGGAGTLGFLSVAAAAREFEVAADMDTPETMALALAGRLVVEIKASIPIVQQELVAVTAIMT